MWKQRWKSKKCLQVSISWATIAWDIGITQCVLTGRQGTIQLLKCQLKWLSLMPNSFQHSLAKEGMEWDSSCRSRVLHWPLHKQGFFQETAVWEPWNARGQWKDRSPLYLGCWGSCETGSKSRTLRGVFTFLKIKPKTHMQPSYAKRKVCWTRIECQLTEIKSHLLLGSSGNDPV